MNSHTTRSFRRLRALGFLVAYALCWLDTEAQSASESPCPGCVPRAAEEAAESPAASGSSASQVRCAEAAPLTSAIADDFGLERLEAFLEQRNIVAGQFADDGTTEIAPPGERSATVELRFDVGEFSYYKKTVDAAGACDDSIWSDAHVWVRIGNGLLSFDADGRLWKGKNEPSAHFYADADLLAATGSYRPRLDLARAHVAKIEVALYVSPGQLRGDINSAVAYFRDEAQLQRYRQGDWSAYAARTTLFSLGFPGDRCEDHELPFAHDEAIERLDNQSADEWRSRALGLIGETAIIDAVWKDGERTEVAVEPGEQVSGTVCLGTSTSVGHHLAPASELALRIPLAGRLRSTDARLDTALDELVIGIDDGTVVRATLRLLSAPLSDAQKAALGANADAFSARLSYDFEREPASLDGIVELLAQTTPDRYRRVGCVAFPRGGKADVDDCRYGSVPPATAR
ncbi:MAG TPA: hypothetical protein VGL98_14235 [Gammaproteobacteria bacterium]